MCILSSWEQGDVLGCHVCAFLSPREWLELRAVHKRLARQLHEAEMRWLFAQRLQGRVAASMGLGRGSLPEERCLGSLAPLLAMASAVNAVADVLQDAAAHPHLLDPDFGPVRRVLALLHHLTLRDRQLMPRERRGRRSSLPRRLLVSFAALSGLMQRLVALLVAFPADAVPSGVFVTVCEVLASLIHNAKESKRAFVAAGGLVVLLTFLRSRPNDAAVQAAGLAALLALSARSVLCIRLMADAGAHEVATTALDRFSEDAKVLARATGLLANMSNVPCVCPALQRCGILALAHRLLTVDGPGLEMAQEPPTPFVRDFVQYLLLNLQEHDMS